MDCPSNKREKLMVGGQSGTTYFRFKYNTLLIELEKSIDFCFLFALFFFYDSF
jgi:hypothetical protein